MTVPERIWIVIPTQAGAISLDSTIRAYLDGMRQSDRVIVMVNGDPDGAVPLIKEAGQEDPRVSVLVDRRRLGKGGALIAGLRYVARSASPQDLVCFVDPDGGITPSDLGWLCTQARGGELTIGSRWLDPSRQVSRQPLHHRLANRLFNRFVKHILKIELADTQCPAKVMKVSDLSRLILRLNQSGQEFDIDLLLAAREVGLAMRELPISWSYRKEIKRHLVTEGPRALIQVLGLRRKYKHSAVFEDRADPIYRLPMSGGDQSVGDPQSTFDATRKVRTLSWGQRVVVALILAGIAWGLYRDWMLTIVGINAVLLGLITIGNIMKLWLVRRSLTRDVVIEIDPRSDDWLEDADLPVYTILLPVYREAGMLKQLVGGIEQLNYPMSRLDVKLLLEEDDVETLEAAKSMGLPDSFDIIVVPDIGPKGKPRACNAGLAQARGEYLVIYDAEDRPVPNQLRDAVAAFRSAPGDVVCLQAQLNYFNRTHNILTRWFTAEYSMWFDLLLPGLQSIDVAIPLGGTSNHFIVERLSQLRGWDAYNVTEDADLGVRIYQRGWKTAILDSTTFEEATSKYRNWIRQRSRWVKGYIQTYFVHSRHPLRTIRGMGIKSFAVFELFVGVGTLTLLVNPFYWLLTVAWFTGRFHVIQEIFPPAVFYMGLAGLIIGNTTFTIVAVAGCYSRSNHEDVKWALLSPVYWVLLSVGAWKGLLQLFYKPYYWEKTTHGYCLIDSESTDDDGQLVGSGAEVAS